MTEPKQRTTTTTSIRWETQRLAGLLQAAIQRESGIQRVNMVDVFALALREACERRGVPTDSA